MILYNVSVIVEDSTEAAIYSWLTTELQDNSYQAKLLKMLDSPHEGSTYCIQIVAKDEERIGLFQQEVLQRLQEYISTHHAEKAFIFDSRMQYITLD